MTQIFISKTQLQTKLDRAWNALQSTITEAEESDLTTRTDAAGWTPKDHLAHLTAWGNSVIVMVRDGRPQWEGLGVDQALYDGEDIDAVNEVVRQQSADLSLKKVTTQLTDMHNEMLRVLEGMSDNDLLKSCSAYVEGGQDVEIVHKFNGNGPDHYDEHRAYIEKILKA